MISKTGKKVVIKTSELKEKYFSKRKVDRKNPKGIEFNYFLPKSEAVQYTHQDFRLDPYTLGVLIGDGSLTQQCRITTADPEILEKIPYLTKKLKGKYEYSVLGLNKIIRDLGLNIKSEDKHIPEEYFFGSIEQRYALLRGLMDTDGSVLKNGEVEFATSSSVLAKGVLQLGRSLGIICKVSVRKTTHLDSYRVKLFTNEPIFSLERKLKRLRSTTSPSFEKTALIEITDAEADDAVCISVDHPSQLFLATANYIPTHNTYMVGVGIVLHQ